MELQERSLWGVLEGLQAVLRGNIETELSVQFNWATLIHSLYFEL